ncbi:MAG: ABC transporter ATP-binding protein [Actinobacteria bacterium]|nr:ABC transporter ATP-binding protein [Actinomycetota bacterium]
MISVRDLRVSYGGTVVAHVPEFDLATGQVLGIAGESGSGKSQTALALMGLTRYSGGTVTGSVTLDGVELSTLSNRQWRSVRGRKIAMILQSPRAALNPTISLGTLFARTLKLHGVPRSERHARMEQALDEVMLDPQILTRYPHEVSGGQAQRFAIALVAALRVDVLIADEPTSALDVTVQSEVIDVLRNLRESHGTAIVFISHDLAVISELADRVMVMRGGEVVEQGLTEQILHEPAEQYTRDLVAAVPVIGRTR